MATENTGPLDLKSQAQALLEERLKGPESNEALYTPPAINAPWSRQGSLQNTFDPLMNQEQLSGLGNSPIAQPTSSSAFVSPSNTPASLDIGAVDTGQAQSILSNVSSQAQTLGQASEKTHTAIGELAAQEAEEKKPLYEKLQKIDEEATQSIQHRQQLLQETLKQEQVQYEVNNNAFEALKSTIPQNLWEAAGINKVAGIIGAALSGLSATLLNRPGNDALSLITKLADENMARLKMQADLYDRGMSHARNAMVDARELFKNDQLAEDAVRTLMTKQTITQIDAIGNSHTGEMEKLKQQLLNQATQQQLLHTQQSTVGTLATIANAKVNRQLRQDQLDFNNQAKLDARKSSMTIGTFKDAKAATEFEKTSEGVGKALDGLADLENLISQAGASDSDNNVLDRYQLAKVPIQEIRDGMRILHHMGQRVSKEGMEHYNGFTPGETIIAAGDPTGLARKEIVQARKTILKELQAAATAKSVKLNPEHPLLKQLIEDQVLENRESASREHFKTRAKQLKGQR